MAVYEYDAALKRAQQICAELSNKSADEYVKEASARKLSSLQQQQQQGSQQTTTTTTTQNGTQITRVMTFGGVACDSFKIPYRLVGFVIGHKGESLKKIEDETHTRVHIERDGGMERLVTIQGKPASVDAAKRRIDEHMEIANAKEGKSQHNPRQMELRIPASRVGFLIGRGGGTLRDLQQKSRTRIMVPRDQQQQQSGNMNNNGGDEQDTRVVLIDGEAQDCAVAKRLIEELMETADDQQGQGGYNASGGHQHAQYGGSGSNMVQLQVQNSKVGYIIGRGGDTIRRLQQQTGASVKIEQPQGQNEGSDLRTITITGLDRQAVQNAQQAINELLAISNNQPQQQQLGIQQSVQQQFQPSQQQQQFPQSQSMVAPLHPANHSVVPPTLFHQQQGGSQQQSEYDQYFASYQQQSYGQMTFPPAQLSSGVVAAVSAEPYVNSSQQYPPTVQSYNKAPGILQQPPSYSQQQQYGVQNGSGGEGQHHQSTQDDLQQQYAQYYQQYYTGNKNNK